VVAVASLRKLNRRLLRWRRWSRGNAPYTYSLDPRPKIPPGHWRAWNAVVAEQDRRCWAETPEIWLGGPAGEQVLIRDVLGTCDVCGLPDLHRGHGDGIGSCDCPRCDCGVARSSALCSCDPSCIHCLSKTCEGDCDEAYGDSGDVDW
jgi:hypothetical protein